MQDRDLVALPLRLPSQRSAQATTLTILKRFEYQSQMLRSGVVAVDSFSPSGVAQLFIRGAPAAIQQVLGRSKLPSNFRQVCIAALVNSSSPTSCVSTWLTS